MAYAVDFVIDVMSRISSTKPVMFQRDGSLFVASEQGFGHVSYGLQTRSQKRDKYDKELPEILESEDLVIRTIQDKYGGGRKRVMLKKEKQYVVPILFGPDDNRFTLEEMMKTAAALQKLPDDKRIRMISHGERYHSHKYGYACDGIDVWVDSGRVMDRERYLELVRMNETKLLEAISSLEKSEQGNIHAHTDFYSEYNRLKFPKCAIITPNVLVSFPRRGRLSGTSSGTSEWSSSQTHFNGNVIEYGEFEGAHRESPFNFYVTLNSQVFPPAKTADVIASKGEGTISQVRNELDTICAYVAQEPNFIQTINAVHNKACVKEIEHFKKMFPPSRKKKQAKA